MVRVKINVWSYVYIACCRRCSILSTYGGSVRKASTLRVPWHYERAMSSEPRMDFNETNRGWSSSVDPDDQGVCRCPSSTPSRTGLEINGLIFLPLRFEVLG